MELKFIKTSPTENMTLLIETPVPREKQLEIAERLIAYHSVYAEQAGYVEEAEDPRAEKRLQMMAGEFCGNATLSLAAWLAKEKGLGIGERTEILLEVSGAAELVRCELRREEQGFWGRVSMPLPKQITEAVFRLDEQELRLPVVEFDGISHVIILMERWEKIGREQAEQAARLWAKELPPAFGLLLFDEAQRQLHPLVSVENVSLIWERGCGSGTAAIGAYLAMREKDSVAVSLAQPGGSMGVEVNWEAGKIKEIFLTGYVAIVAEGTAYLP